MKKNKVLFIVLLVLLVLLALTLAVFFLVKNKSAEPKDVVKIMVSLPRESTDTQISEMGKNIEKIDGVYSTQFVSKEQALEQVKERLKNNKKLLEGWEADNPFRPYYLVVISPSNKLDSVVEQIDMLDNVAEIMFNRPLSSYSR